MVPSPIGVVVDDRTPPPAAAPHGGHPRASHRRLTPARASHPVGPDAVGGWRAVPETLLPATAGTDARMRLAVFVVHATRKMLARVGKPDLDGGQQSTTALGDWYATALFWRPQVALFVNESTLLPALLPL